MQGRSALILLGPLTDKENTILGCFAYGAAPGHSEMLFALR